MPPKPTTLSSIAISSSRTVTTTRTAQAKAKARVASTATTTKATAPQSLPAPSTISQHFTRILSLWPSDPLRPANLSFQEYIKARAALARSNNQLNYDNNVPSTATSPTHTTPTSPSSDPPVSELPATRSVPTHEASDGQAEDQDHNPNNRGHLVGSGGGRLPVSLPTRHPSTENAGEAEGAAATAAAEIRGTAGERTAGQPTRMGDSSARATAQTETVAAATAPTAAAESTGVAGASAAPVLQDINALYTLLDDRYAKKFPLSTATLNPASNPNHYDALVAELKEAPNLSWFQKTMRRIGGRVRFK